MDYEIFVPSAEESGFDFTVYTIFIRTESSGSWHFRRRYADIRTQYLEHKKVLTKDELPKFPSRTCFGNRAPEFIENRRLELQDYFQQLLKIDKIRECEKFWIFAKPKDAIEVEISVEERNRISQGINECRSQNAIDEEEETP